MNLAYLAIILVVVVVLAFGLWKFMKFVQKKLAEGGPVLAKEIKSDFSADFEQFAKYPGVIENVRGHQDWDVPLPNCDRAIDLHRK